MINLRVTNKGYQVVLDKVRTLDARVVAEGKKAVGRGLFYAQGLAQREYLRGPRPSRMDVVTGRLRNSLWVRVDDSTTSATGRLGSNVKYAARHEFGFSGTENVRAHSRVTRATNDAGERVEPRKAISKGGKRIGWKTSLRAAAEDAGLRIGVAQVRAHSRRIDYKGKPYARPAVARSLPVMIAELKKEIEKA